MGKFCKRDFLLGLGIGLIISAVLVSFFDSPQLSDQEIISRAAKLGMVQPGSRTSQASTSRQVYQNPGLSSPVVGEQTVPPPAGPKSSIQVTVTSGMGSETIARILEEKGAIRDRQQFLKVVTEHQAHTRFRNGTFTIPVGGKMEEILKILTGR